LTPKICVSIMPKNVEEALNLIEKAEKHRADFIEVRLDRLCRDEKLRDITGCTEIPLIATNRPQNCGGKFSGTESERRQVLLNAARSNFEYVDIELDAEGLDSFLKELQQTNVKLIISFHDFQKTPETAALQKVLWEEIAKGAHICKIVTTAKTLMDNLTLLNFLLSSCENAKIVCFAMGPLGKPSRLLSPIFGGFFTIASLEAGGETAPGQMTIEELKTAYRILGVI